MQLFPSEIEDGLEEQIKANSSISYASALTPCSKESTISGLFHKSLASVQDSDLYYTQSILVSSSWNKNDDIFDKDEVWKARHSPEDKPTNLEHDEATIVGHIVSNWPITEDGILIDENTPVENLPEKYHILTGSVIYKAYTSPDLKDRTQALIDDIENGKKYVSMECFFQGFDYGLINKTNGTYKVLPRDASTAHLTKYLKAYGGMGEHENYKIGRVLRNITFSGKGFVDRPANPDSIIFNKDNFKFIQNTNLEKNSNISESGVNNSQSNSNSENKTMSNENTEVVETVVADCTEATQAAETTIAELKTELEALKAAHEILVAEHQEAAKKLQADEDLKNEENQNLKAALAAAEEVIAGYMAKEKKMARKTTLMSYGFDSEKADTIVEKFESLNDETFASMTEMLSAGMPPWLDKNKKKKDQEAKADEAVEADITEVLENVEETSEVALTVGGEDDSAIESTRAALVDFVCTRLSKKLNKGE